MKNYLLKKIWLEILELIPVLGSIFYLIMFNRIFSALIVFKVIRIFDIFNKNID